jgi:hypothetical protein
MHVQLYKSLNLTSEERQRMTELWKKWERQKRQLDVDMDAARTLLAALPSHIPLPREFLAHLNTLLQAPVSAEQEQSQLCARCLASTDSHDHAASALRSCSLPGTSGDSQSSIELSSDTRFPKSSPSIMSSMHFTSLSTFSSAPAYGFQMPVQKQEVGFLGQSAEHVVRAEQALSDLKCIQGKEIDLYTYIVASEMPGIVLGVDKHHRLWADHFMSQKMFPDYIELCQIAATQQNRLILFQKPFLC